MTLGSRTHPSLGFGKFYGELEVRRSSPGIDVSLLNVDPHRVVERHSHDEAHFVLVLDGLYVSSAAGADPVSNGRALIFNPAGTTHRDRFEARARSMEGKFLTISIAAGMMDPAVGADDTPRMATVIRDVNTIAAAVRMVRECFASSADANLARESLALSLVAAVTRARTQQAPSPPRWLAVAREQLDDRCTEDVRIADVAIAAGVHPVHLARAFRRYLGLTPGDYLRRRRIERSRVLLRETRRSLSEIALSSGYADQSHFSSAFKSGSGLTPGAYRRLSTR